jgi:hypothetical protein
MRRDARLRALERCAVLLLGIYLAGVGINVLTRGDTMYANWFHRPVAAPIALTIGIILIVAGFRLHGQQS